MRDIHIENIEPSHAGAGIDADAGGNLRDRSSAQSPMTSPDQIFNASILIVDDEEANCALLETVLANAGYRRVRSCNAPERVRDMHDSDQYDLILLDLEMPGKGGMEVMEELKSLDPEGYLPVIVITGHGSSKLDALKAGARDFVHKPFDIEEILLRIHNTLEIRIAHQQALSTSAQLETLALHDPLTGLANRRLLQDRVRMALKHVRRERGQMALLYLDLDGFKAVNDSLGHHAGDVLLQQVAERLQGAVRADDTVARLGGDEFMVALSRVAGAKEAARVADKIIEALAEPYDLEGAAARVTASIGLALYPEHGDNADALMQGADAALYEAKESGKNAYRIAGSAQEPRRKESASGNDSGDGNDEGGDDGGARRRKSSVGVRH
jgi:diguanylate cyclase (GGDEF)-like protein